MDQDSRGDGTEPAAAPELVVGFDLDMTLIDSRPGIGAVYTALSEETGVPIDVEVAIERLGPPLAEEIAHWFPAEVVAETANRFREMYPDLAITPTGLLPGARESLAAVAALGGRSLVITAKYEPNARLHLHHLDLRPDLLLGWCWGPGKTEALLANGAGVYVGDHPADMAAAVAAGAVGVGVLTGPSDDAELRQAGATMVMPDLTGFPDWLAGHLLDLRLGALERRLAELGSLVVAFSGGADSAFLLAAAVRALGADQVVAATAVSSSLPSSELDAARAFAADLGVRHLLPATDELEVEGYRANAGDRCYFCKAELLDVLRPAADDLGHAHVATGTNADDAVAGFRPGLRAAAERGAVTPLLDARLTKSQVRAASRRWGLPTWDKPAAACLSSRIAYGIEITRERLSRVEQAEAGLRRTLVDAGLDVRDLRVRDLGEAARVEVDGHLVDLLGDRPELLGAVRAAGFDRVEVDPRGFRSGAMNELLAEPERYR